VQLPGDAGGAVPLTSARCRRLFAVLRAYSGSPGAPNWQGFFRPARQKIAGILAVLQDFL